MAIAMGVTKDGPIFDPPAHGAYFLDLSSSAPSLKNSSLMRRVPPSSRAFESVEASPGKSTCHAISQASKKERITGGYCLMLDSEYKAKLDRRKEARKGRLASIERV